MIAFSGLLPSCTGTSVGDLPCFSQINLRLETSVFCQGYQGVTYLATRKSNRTWCGAADSVSRLETREVGDRAITVDGPSSLLLYSVGVPGALHSFVYWIGFIPGIVHFPLFVSRQTCLFSDLPRFCVCLM